VPADGLGTRLNHVHVLLGEKKYAADGTGQLPSNFSYAAPSRYNRSDRDIYQRQLRQRPQTLSDSPAAWHLLAPAVVLADKLIAPNGCRITGPP
jgi:hypothetical protein